MSGPTLRLLLVCALAAPLALGCPKKGDESEEEDKPKKKKKSDEPAASASATSSAATTAVATATATAAPQPVTASGPTIAIPAGTLRAGSRCHDVPRIRPEELEHDEVSMGAFTMDTHPYPNEPGKPAAVNVTFEQAEKLCADRGKRLCTELEWEWACKGAKNTTYPWGEGFVAGKCPARSDKTIGQRADCVSSFGMSDPLGLAFEWTASDWERGTPTGDKVVRGDPKTGGVGARCANAEKRNPHETHDDVGFRCCSGSVNGAKVVLAQRIRTPIEEISDIDPQFELTLMKAMPQDHRAITDVELSFDKVWRWHPVANEEMLIGRWKGQAKGSAPFFEIAVFKLCGGVALRAAGMRGPVQKTGLPKHDTSPAKVSFDVTTEKDDGVVTLTYSLGGVKLEQPDFVKKGNQLKVKKDDKPHPRLKLPRIHPK
jgi:formylglycine-generating enzyme required for sulfatase activity